jgi:hypothetical protein
MTESLSSKKFPLIVSYYTQDTLYCLEAQNLIASCERFGLKYCVEAIPSFGSWELNCAYKPFFLLEKMQLFQQPLLWIDADGVFESSPTWIEAFGGDIALRWDEQAPLDCPSKAISSTIFIGVTEKVKQLLRLWALETEQQFNDPKRVTEFWDQIALRDCLVAGKIQLDLRPLPIPYAHIFDHHSELEDRKPVIVHYQASRRLKHLISYKR